MTMNGPTPIAPVSSEQAASEPLCPRALITRPEPEASRWVRALNSKGVPAHVLPLIAIKPVPDAAALIETFSHLGSYAALMFVSGNAVRHFFTAFKRFSPRLLESGLLEMAAWSPGPGTSAVLRECGWPSALIVQPAADAAQFDSESLWQSVRAHVRPEDRVLIVRGGDTQGRSQGRDWLAEQLTHAGVTVEQVVAYCRTAPIFDAEQKALARQAAGDGTVWVFSSSEAIANLRKSAAGQNWQKARALVTHPRIAQAAREAGFGTVRQSRPVMQAVVQTLLHWDDEQPPQE